MASSLRWSDQNLFLPCNLLQHRVTSWLSSALVWRITGRKAVVQWTANLSHLVSLQYASNEIFFWPWSFLRYQNSNNKQFLQVETFRIMWPQPLAGFWLVYTSKVSGFMGLKWMWSEAGGGCKINCYHKQIPFIAYCLLFHSSELAFSPGGFFHVQYFRCSRWKKIRAVKTIFY